MYFFIGNGAIIMRERKSRTDKLKVKITICLFIVIAVLIVQKIDGHEENRIVSAVMDYYSRDYSVEEVAAAMSEGLQKAEKIPDMLKEEKMPESDAQDIKDDKDISDTSDTSDVKDSRDVSDFTEDSDTDADTGTDTDVVKQDSSSQEGGI